MTTPIGAPPPAPVPSDDLDRKGLGTEIGRPGNIQVVYSTRGDREWAPKFADPNPVLQFPHSMRVFSVMSRTDEQVDGVLRAVQLPIVDASWELDGDGVKPEVVDFIRSEIGLPVPGEGLGHRLRHQAGILFSEHITEAVESLTYGWMPFEQVYSVTVPGDPGHPASETFTTQPAIHLRKLAARPPATIRRIRVAEDGGLVSLYQTPMQGDPYWGLALDGQVGVEIPINRLVVYVNDKKGADWTGVSILRTAYKAWKAKEELVRLDNIASERNSLGLPVVEYDPLSVSEDAALELARQARSGAEAGIVVPLGCRFSLVGVSGSVPDLGPKIDRYNEAIGRASLAMFLNLGHDNGARALGDTFLEFFNRSLQSVAGKIAATFTEHVIRDLVEYNWGGEEPYPRLVAENITAEVALLPGELKDLVGAKVIVPDDELEAALRRRYRLPIADPSTARETAPPPKPEPAVPDLTLPGVGDLPPVADPQAGDSAADQPPSENPFKPVAAADPDGDGQVIPDGMVHVPAHDRKWPARKVTASLTGYAAYLNTIIDGDADAAD